MIEFSYPWMAILLILPFIVNWLSPVYKEKKSAVQVPFFQRLVSASGEKPQSGAVVLTRKFFQKFVVATAWICIVTALAQPQHVGEPIKIEKTARDLMIAVDLSGSMSVQDFTDNSGQVVDRLTAVKQVLTDFAKERQSDRLGLILFGDAPYLQAPFTDDIATWQSLLNESQIGMAGQSTAFGDAIGLAISVFDNSSTDNRVLIVLTDGNDTASKVPPVEAAKIAKQRDIKIYSIAIGDPEAVGEEKVDVEALEEIAKLTGGNHYQALNRSELIKVYDAINQLEPELFDSQSYRPKTSLHYVPLILFALLYLASLVIVSLTFKLSTKEQVHEQ